MNPPLFRSPDRTTRRGFLQAGIAAPGFAQALSPPPLYRTLNAQTPQAEFPAPANSPNTFTVQLTVDCRSFAGEKSLLEISNVLSVRLRRHDPLDRQRQNYPAFKMPDGSVPVLEASVVLHSREHPDWTNMTIGIPLAMLKRPEGLHEIVLAFSGVRWTMYVDGELLDNDFPFGYPQWAGRTAWKIDAEYVRSAAIHLPAISPTSPAKEPTVLSAIQYWTPPGHNSWVGDVVTLFDKARYHVFYLYDRRHHQSKFGKGAHYFEHLSTTDFKTWIEHPAATPIEEQWECIGTGTPFIFNKRFYLSYGLHTGRIYPEDKTTWPAQKEFLKKNGRTGAFPRATTPGIPAGATYSVSTDGISSFRKSGIMFHPCQNPSVYIDPQGQLRMLANAGSSGIWESESVDGGWHCTNPGFPPGGDCTFFFRWGKFDYIIGGFTGLWSKLADAPDSAYEDMVRKGLDFYDGSNVPAITEIAGGRFLMAAWIPIRGWGGPLVIRELVQFPDGRIGSKWMPEVTPETGKAKTVALTDLPAIPAEGKSFLLVFDLHPSAAKGGRLGISFLPETGMQASCELQIGLDERRAQFAPGSLGRFADPVQSLREGGKPGSAGNYAIENLIGVDRPFTVRVLVKANDKIGGSLVDVEIAGQRTMISYRPDLAVEKLFFRTRAVALRNLQLAPLQD